MADKDGETFEFIFSYSHRNHKTIILKCSPNIRDAIHKNNNKIKIGFSFAKYTIEYMCLSVLSAVDSGTHLETAVQIPKLVPTVQKIICRRKGILKIH